MKIISIGKWTIILFLLGTLMSLSVLLYIRQNYTFASTATKNLQDLIQFKDPSKEQPNNQVKQLPQNSCKPKQNVLFLKTYKSYSSNIENIFFRYRVKYNLTFLMPKSGNSFGPSQTSNREMLHSQPMPGPLSSIGNNTLRHHAKYNHEEMKSIMPADTIFVTILTDPTSLTDFFSSNNILQGNMNDKKFAIRAMQTFFSNSSNTPALNIPLNRDKLGTFQRNQISLNLGLDIEQFDNLEMIKKFINTIDSQFHLVMIAGRMEESLIHLQRLLCWTLDDIIVFRHNVQKAGLSNRMSVDRKNKMRSFNNADYLLYEHFSAKLTSQTETFGKTEVQKQISSLKQATKLMYDKCVDKEALGRDLKVFKPRRFNQQPLGFKRRNSTDKKCRDLTTSRALETDIFAIHANPVKA